MRRSPLKRKTALAARKPMQRKTAVRKRRPTPRRSSRVRDRDFMLWVKTLLCSVKEERPSGVLRIYTTTACDGPIEADHDSRGRGIGQKSSDTTCIPMCHRHHMERTNHTGSFKFLTRDEKRAWFDRAQFRTRTLYAEHNRGEQIG